jgi:S1-C subfamily serine protease
VAELRDKGKVVRNVWTGFESQAVDARVARYFGMSEVRGIIISDVYRKGPAEKAGIKVGDIVLEVNGDKVNSEEELASILDDANPGDVMKLKVYRDRKTMNVELKLERKPA